MSDTERKSAQEEAGLSYQGQPVLLAIPNGVVIARRDEESGLFDYWTTVWQGRFTVLVTCVVFALTSAAYALLATPIYRAQVLLAPVVEDEMQGALLGQLGGLAGLAGIAVGGAQSNAEALAVLRSRDFTRRFIEDGNLMPVLYAKEWDAVNGKWLENDPELQPDIREAVRYVDESIRVVKEDKATSLVSITVDWLDGRVAADWANTFAVRLNASLRARALAEAERNIAYLSEQLEKTSVLTLQQAASNLLEREMQKLMMAQGNEEFAFRIIDRAESPKRRVWPARTLIVIAATVAGGMMAIIFLLVRSEVRRQRAAVRLSNQ